ncbi:MAG: hypothetical protein R3C68_03485 [Myxococcota bacterium]
MDLTDEIAKDASCQDDPVSRGLLCSIPSNSYVFLDPTCRNCRFGELPTELTGGRALIATDAGAQWVDVPIDPPARNRTMTQVHLKLDVSGQLSGKLTGEFTGAVARRVRQALSDHGATLEERSQIVKTEIMGRDHGMNLREPEITGRNQSDQPLQLRAKVATNAPDLGEQRYEISALALVGTPWSQPLRPSHRYPAILMAPAWVETAVSVRLPVGYTIQETGVSKLIEPFAEYASGFAKHGRSLNFSRRLIIKEHILSTAQWRNFYSFIERIKEIEAKGVTVGVRQ